MPAPSTFVPAAISSSDVVPLSTICSTTSDPDSSPRCRRVRPASASNSSCSGARRASVRARPYVVTRSTVGKRSFTRRITAASFSGFTAHGSASCRNADLSPARRNSSIWYDCSGSSPARIAAQPFARRTSATAAIASTSASTSSSGRSDESVPL